MMCMNKYKVSHPLKTKTQPNQILEVYDRLLVHMLLEIYGRLLVYINKSY